MTRTLIYEAAPYLLIRYGTDTNMAIWVNELQHRMGYKKVIVANNIEVEYVEIRNFL